MSKTYYLFSYGTLQFKPVQLNNYGRELKGHRDRLLGYKLDNVEIADQVVIQTSGLSTHPIAVKSENPLDSVEGMLFQITEAELRQTDAYEVADYQRVLKVFESGKKGWIYVAKSELTSIKDKVETVKDRMVQACLKAGRSPRSVKLLLATKTVEPERIIEAFECGETLIGENKMQEVQAKYDQLASHRHEQHFIGHLQRNKIKSILKYNISCIQSLDNLRLAEQLNQRLALEERTIEVLIQINTSGESSKFGLQGRAIMPFVEQVSKLKQLKVKGLMTIGKFSANSTEIRACFKRLKQIQEQIQLANIPNVEMQELSMGMSNDLEIAIAEGSTMIRVGTAIFGDRIYPDAYYWNEGTA